MKNAVLSIILLLALVCVMVGNISLFKSIIYFKLTGYLFLIRFSNFKTILNNFVSWDWAVSNIYVS